MLVTNTLAGLRSRCTTPSAWAWASPRATSTATCTASWTGSGPSLDPLLQGLPAQQLEDQVRPVLAPPHLVERDQVGVGEPRDGLGLARPTFAVLLA